jgi:alpha galactosidase C-like protein
MRRFSAISVLFILLSVLSAQTNHGGISGTVTDAAKVTVKWSDVGVTGSHEVRNL